MSSVPIQFLFYAYTPSGSCSTPPVIIGDRPNRGMSVNFSLDEIHKLNDVFLYLFLFSFSMHWRSDW
jgi:hypothetical protein